MTWSYSGDPDKNDKDGVRFLIQDTDECEQFFSDEEINSLVTSEGGVLPAALRAAEILIGKFARYVDEQVGGVRVSLSQRLQAYKDLKNELRQRLAMTNVEPFAGGISYSQKYSEELNNDRVEPSFTTDMMDYVEQPDENRGPEINRSIQDEENP